MHPDSQRLGRTWLEPEELAYNTGFSRRRAQVLLRENVHNPLKLQYGSLRIVRCSIPDTFSSIPARLRVSGRTVHGFISVTESDEGSNAFTFTPEANPKQCTTCRPGEGCKR